MLSNMAKMAVCLKYRTAITCPASGRRHPLAYRQRLAVNIKPSSIVLSAMGWQGDGEWRELRTFRGRRDGSSRRGARLLMLVEILARVDVGQPSPIEHHHLPQIG